MGDHGCEAFAAAALVAATVVATPAPAASFDCAKAASRTERLICSNPALGARDEILSKLYGAALREEPSGPIKANQREWLVKADTCGTAACLGDAYDERIERLLRTKGGNGAATHFFTEEPKGNSGTLDVVGPIHGFAYVSLVSTYVGPGGVENGDVNTIGTGGFLDLRRGKAEFTDRGCIVSVHPEGRDAWQVDQRGTCDLPSGTVYAGTYRP
ncbi:lysozyme inhibitor LprI family protein [Methylobacterium sp. J-068]|uniref:lysozyme inhibitor LprI family protein n=1 Tax=Methylobacterium sp. J-068 TaxID=2836649 RepID=UPI001FBA0C8D|nr:hypothetical protein [Methylobacterium sp. J-068]MCJ2033833.1 hypothetical protein [Methylobacterium sp. J-068]